MRVAAAGAVEVVAAGAAGGGVGELSAADGGGGSLSGGSGYRGFSGSTAGASRFTPNNPGSGALARQSRQLWPWGGRRLGLWLGNRVGILGLWRPYLVRRLPFWYSTLGYGATRIRITPTRLTTVGTITGCRFSRTVPELSKIRRTADNQFFAEARAAFYAGNYPEALRNIEHAAIAPSDERRRPSVPLARVLRPGRLSEGGRRRAHGARSRAGLELDGGAIVLSLAGYVHAAAPRAGALHHASIGSRHRHGSCWLTSI